MNNDSQDEAPASQSGQHPHQIFPGKQVTTTRTKVGDCANTQILNEYRLATIAYYRACIRDVMLGRIVMFGGDPRFRAVCKALANDLRITQAEAAQLLWPTSHAIYAAAEGAHE